ncbi:MAG: AraC family transcriptional regulator [Deltaproteobacteria bacterium]|nr:AraC family transcriptional regulator [Deltaproteobacteria bacterium]
MTIAGEQPIHILRSFDALGVPVDELCARLGLTRSGLGGPGTRVSRVLFDTLFLAAAEMTGDPLLGMRAGMAKTPADLLFFLSASQRTLGEALREFARLFRVVGASMRASVEVRGATAWLHVSDTAPGQPEALRHELEYLAGQLVQYLALATRGACRPTEIRFAHPPAGPTVEYERILGVPVRFRSEAFQIGLSAVDLDTAVVTANADIARMTREAAQQQLEAAESGSFRARVELALRRRIQQDADHSREGVAALLATSVGTLKRRLSEENCSFRDVRDDVRRAVAEEMLARTEKSVSEIAALLDFADAASFGKAFRRWTGANPRDFRARKRSG